MAYKPVCQLYNITLSKRAILILLNKLIRLRNKTFSALCLNLRLLSQLGFKQESIFT